MKGSNGFWRGTTNISGNTGRLTPYFSWGTRPCRRIRSSHAQSLLQGSSFKLICTILNDLTSVHRSSSHFSDPMWTSLTSIRHQMFSTAVFMIRWLPDECEPLVKTPCSLLPATHNSMAAVMRDQFQLFKYYSCCQGDKGIIVIEFSKDRQRSGRHASEGYNVHTHPEHAVRFSRACSVTTAEPEHSCLLIC